MTMLWTMLADHACTWEGLSRVIQNSGLLLLLSSISRIAKTTTRYQKNKPKINAPLGGAVLPVSYPRGGSPFRCHAS